MENKNTGMSWLALTDEFKDTKKDPFYNLSFTKDEEFYVRKGELSESNIKDWHFYLKRNLTKKELMVLELCSKNAILLSENDFKSNI